jgi:hypothetical protein
MTTPAPGLIKLARKVDGLDLSMPVDINGNPLETVTGCKSRYPLVKVKPSLGVWQIKEQNEAAGLHFFKPETMSFFKSKVHKCFGKGVFVTSETSPYGGTAYSLRVGDLTGQVETFGEFHSYTSSQATADGKRLSYLLREGFTVVDCNGLRFALCFDSLIACRKRDLLSWKAELEKVTRLQMADPGELEAQGKEITELEGDFRHAWNRVNFIQGELERAESIRDAQKALTPPPPPPAV